METPLPTGINGLDRLMKGGIPLKQVTLIYGAAKTGKTTLLLQTAINTASRFKVLYLDVDSTFNVRRFKQISDKDRESVSQNILIFAPETFEQQTSIVESLENYVTGRTRLIAVDAISTLYRVGSLNAVERFSRNRELNRQLAYLTGLAFQHNLAVLVSSPVRSAMATDPTEIEPVAKRTLFHWPETIIRLKSTQSVSVRQVVIERLSSSPTGLMCRLRLCERGFTDMD